MSEAESVPRRDAAPAPSRISFTPRPTLVVGLALGGLFAAALTVVLDNPGRLLFAVLTAGLLIEATRLALVRPTLIADRTGVSVRRVARTHCYPWPEIGAVGARTTRRLVSVPTLELDLGDTLIVIASYRLGAAPAEVAAAIEKLRPSGD